MQQFLADVLRGLSAPKKYLQAKYFYDSGGDEIFEEIMAMPEYYLTGCEWEILSRQKEKIAEKLSEISRAWDVVELGPGNAVKSGELICAMQVKEILETYFPIDISANIIDELQRNGTDQFSRVPVKGYVGEYFQMLPQIQVASENPKLILLLGANIGNFTPIEMNGFLSKLRGSMTGKDLALIGFDLKKHPRIIQNAYDDKAGITARFNLNLLERINRELEGDFTTANFEHFCCYDPQSGACSSYLVSLANQKVCIGNSVISFKKDETIFMETSQKYTAEEIEGHTANCGFKTVEKYFDKRRWFLDVLLQPLAPPITASA